MNYEFIDGSDAIVRAAIISGCSFYAGYPISPSTKIHLKMIKEIQKTGGMAIQCEDEIASISMCIAASMAGSKAMTATSGPGISLYSENIGLAIMGEVPIVIIDVQRMGPATGGATTGAQGDIQFVRWPTSGGLPMVVLSPSSIESMYRLTIKAFNISEILRIPVILLTSKEMALTKQTVDTLNLTGPGTVNRNYFRDKGEFIPYKFKRLHDIPDFLPIGADKPVRFTTSIHDEKGYLTRDPVKIDRKIRHLEQKILKNRDIIDFVIMDLDPGSENLIIAYGINSGVSEEAVKIVRKKGGRCSLLIIESLFPPPGDRIREALSGAERVIIPELNIGLYAETIRAFLSPGQEIVKVNRLDGDLISSGDIIEAGKLL